jgi:NAD(P)-dependent dehydrogenase (short-subunit alcohol dehydrogenase family)
MGRLGGRIALVTGAVRGIGYAVASCFHAEGAHVVLSDIDDDDGRAATASAVAPTIIVST